ncbi:MAG: alpha-2-macroglobulin, partial [Spirochaetales bacterium]
MARPTAKTAVIAAILLSGILVLSCAKKFQPAGDAAGGNGAENSTEVYKNVSLGTKLADDKITYYEKSALAEAPAVSTMESDEPFTLVDFGPRDELPPEIKKPSIYVVFSQPVIPIAKLGPPAAASSVMDIFPAVKGVFRWYGTRLLSFEAEENVLPQREYTVRINPGVTSLGGKPLEGSNGFTFRTEYLSVRNLSVGDPGVYYDMDDVPLEAAKNIRLTFSYPVNLDVIANYLSVESGGRTWPFSLSRPEAVTKDGGDASGRVLLTMKDPFPENTDVSVLLLKGARSEKDYLGIPETAANSFHTLRPFSFIGYDTYSWSFPRSKTGSSNPLYLEFSHPLESPESLAGKIRTMPAMGISADNVNVWYNSVRINNLPVEPESSYALFLSGSIKDIYGRSLKRSERITVEVPPAERYAYFPNTGSRMLESQFPK